MGRRLPGWRWAVAGLILTGLLERAWVLRGALGDADGDEAVAGLMAREFGHGRFRAFYWGQHYAGSLEPALVWLAGGSAAALKLVPMVLAAATCVLLWRFGRRVIDDRLAQAAALLAWVAPGVYVWWSTKERGFYWASMALGVLLLLAAARLVQEQHHLLDGALFGIAAGLGFWTSPTVVYFAAPALVWLAVRRPSAKWLLAATPAAVIGAMPWLWHNVGHGFPSLDAPPRSGPYLESIGRLLWKTLPIATNLRHPIRLDWYAGWLGTVVFVALGVALLVSVVVRRDRPLVLFCGLAAFPFLYAAFPGAYYVGEGRYGLFTLPFVALALAWLVRRPGAAVALCVVAIVPSIAILRTLGASRPHDRVSGDLRALRHAEVTHLWSDYWSAYRLGFESGGWLTASPMVSQRYQRFAESVSRSSRPAFAYPKGDPRVDALRRALGPRSSVLRTEHYDVVVADGEVDVRALPRGLDL
jgi:hypothetical protein